MNSISNDIRIITTALDRVGQPYTTTSNQVTCGENGRIKISRAKDGGSLYELACKDGKERPYMSGATYRNLRSAIDALIQELQR